MFFISDPAAHGDRQRGRFDHAGRVRERQPDARRVLAQGQGGHRHQGEQVQDPRWGIATGQFTVLEINIFFNSGT